MAAINTLPLPVSANTHCLFLGYLTARSTDTRLTDVAPRHHNPLTLALLASLWIAGFANWPLWHALLALPETHTPRGMVFMLAFFGIVAALTFLLLARVAGARKANAA